MKMYSLSFAQSWPSFAAFAWLGSTLPRLLAAVALGGLPLAAWMIWPLANPVGTPYIKPFAAVYQVPDGDIQIEYVNPHNFRLAFSGGSETLVSAGRLYVVQKRAGYRDTALLISDSVQRKADQALQAPTLRRLDHAAISSNLLAAGTNGLYAATLQRPGALRSTDMIVAKDPQLAQAQLIMRETLLQMNMSLCSNAVQYLLAWWVPEFTRNGYAVISTASGVSLKSPPNITGASKSIELNPQALIQDYRIVSTQQ
jgi:hypothetical protein